MELEIANNLKEIKYESTKDMVHDVCQIIDTSQNYAYQAVNIALIKRNYLIGKRIAEEQLKGMKRADYGNKIILKLSKELTKKYGKGFDKSNLYHFLNFYNKFQNIFDTLCRKSKGLLSWSHYRVLLQVDDKNARDWYENEALNETWPVRTLQRNIDSQYYYRLLMSQVKKPVIEEMKEITKDFDNAKLEFIKNPIIAEFLGFSQDSSFTETELEKSIITNLQKFLVELGKGYAFVGRQYHIHTEKQEYFIDLVFYNYILKCFVLIDLKTCKITHQDIGQMDMYVRMFDELEKNDDDNPTLGIVLCTETDEDIARYSILKGNEQLFASKYKLYLPNEEILRKEIKIQKEIYNMQHSKK